MKIKYFHKLQWFITIISSLSPEQKASCAKELSHKEDEPADYKDLCMSFSFCIFVFACVCVWGCGGIRLIMNLDLYFGNQKNWTRADNVYSANSYKGSSQTIDWNIRVKLSRTHHNIWPKLFGTDHHCHRVWTRLNQADLRLIGSERQHKREMISKHGNDS